MSPRVSGEAVEKIKNFPSGDHDSGKHWRSDSSSCSSCLFPATKPNKEWLSFYRTGPIDTLFHLGFVFTWLAIFHWINRKVPANLFFSLLNFCSRNITSIYIIQWVMICWGMTCAGYLSLGFLKTFCWMGAISTITFLLAALLKRVYAKPKNL